MEYVVYGVKKDGPVLHLQSLTGIAEGAVQQVAKVPVLQDQTCSHKLEDLL